MLFLKADANLDGKITQAEFSAVVQAFDKNGDGAVTRDEFVDGWVALTKQTRAEANAYFHVGDLNHDKVIDQKDHDMMYTVFDQNEFLLPSDTCNVPNGITETRCRCKEGFIALNESCLGKSKKNVYLKGSFHALLVLFATNIRGHVLNILSVSTVNVRVRTVTKPTVMGAKHAKRKRMD
ncbi:hypothetical protein DPMN_155118 [Dreissena polymorpha]|uniref:EF-hand domain-containing protein n=1 Tax=Dreissena polymorpha TaxID=45954 RepID=A0A9D4FT53_DREPO|nr:hypothetical protein DPMN_155118 [Dreissena polymorpha]